MANLYTVGFETEEMLSKEEISNMTKIIAETFKEVDGVKKVHYVAVYGKGVIDADTGEVRE